MRYLQSTFLIAILFGTMDSAGQAAENLWLDRARSSITSHELRSHVGVLADDTLEGREAGSRGGHAAARYLIKRLEEAALQAAGDDGAYSQRFHGRSQNLLATLEGSDPELKGETIVVGAHYDHVGYGTRRNSYGPWGYIHNGADDNASGVSTLLEVIDALVHGEYRPRRTILFAFWDGEEKGLLGSKHWMKNPTLPVSSIRLAINIDMVGRLTNGRIEIMGTRTGAGLRQLMSTTRLSGANWIDYPWEIKDNSDHWTFYEANIPTLCVHTGLHDDYHRPSDDVEKINFEGLQEVSRYLLEQLCELADADQLPEFRSKARQESSKSRQAIEASLPALAQRFNFAWQYTAEQPGEVVVKEIQQDSQAAEAGLVVGDKIVAVNGQPINSEAMLPAMAFASESEIELEVVRTGSAEPISLTLPLEGKRIRLGLSWRSNDAEPGSVYITRVVPYSPAANAGLAVHDRIYSLNGESFIGQEDLFARVQEMIEKEAPELQFLVETRGNLREISVSFKLPEPPVNDSTL